MSAKLDKLDNDDQNFSVKLFWGEQPSSGLRLHARAGGGHSFMDLAKRHANGKWQPYLADGRMIVGAFFALKRDAKNFAIEFAGLSPRPKTLAAIEPLMKRHGGFIV